MRICSNCRQEKDDTEFNWKNKTKEIRSHQCKICQTSYSKQHYLDNKQDYINRSTRDRDKCREKIKQLIKSLKISCADCGLDHPAILDFHHLDPSEKEYQIARLTSKKRILHEVAKCVVLCSNCHRIRHWNEKNKLPL